MLGDVWLLRRTCRDKQFIINVFKDFLLRVMYLKNI
ncbi:MAG: hypothetical protein ACRYGK_12410 [Janthinobacterium lividum]